MRCFLSSGWLLAVICLHVCCGNVALADPPAKDDARAEEAAEEEATGDAQAVYRQLLAEYVHGTAEGVAHLELLHTWSARIAQAAVLTTHPSSSNLAAVLDRGRKEHEVRMRELEKIAARRVEAGVARQAEQQAARYYVAEADQLFKWLRRLEQEREMDVQLPAASESRPLTAQSKELIVNVTEDGRIFGAGKSLTLKELTDRLAALKKSKEIAPSVIIRADHQTPSAHVIEVINACNKAGVALSLTTTSD